jgi:AcrR family transcriptional regulator
VPGNFKREDLRVIKTRKALTSALYVLLQRQPFSKITVYDICMEALVSRTAFYTHFCDKYDLLEQWLQTLREKLLQRLHTQPSAVCEQYICTIVLQNTKVIANLFADMDEELQQLLLRQLSPAVAANQSQQVEALALSRFFAGGFLYTLLAYATHKEPEAELRRVAACLHQTVRATIAGTQASPI